MRGRMLAGIVLAALLPSAPAVAAGDPVMPLSEVRAGMQCTGYSVFRGTAVEAFEVEVLDVVGPATTGTTTRILVRASGENVDRTGIGPGFSGSPIYCPRADGVPANIGAISESVGDYGGDTVLATPIEAILATPVDPPAPLGAGATRSAGAMPSAGAARAASSSRGSGAGLSARDAAILARAKPLTSPLTVRGLSRAVRKDLARAANRRGMMLLQAPPAPANPPARQPLVPGSAVGVGMSSGDIAVGAVGTVAYTDGPATWMFGHLFDGAGGRALLLQDAHVSAVIGNPVQTMDSGTYKLAGPVNDIGTVTYDGFDAVTGRVGGLPPVTHVRVYTTDQDRGTDRETYVKVADETDAGSPLAFTNVSFIAPLAITDAATQALGAAPVRLAGQMCFQVRVRELRAPLKFCNRYVSDGTYGFYDGGVGNIVALAAGTDAASALTLFDFYTGPALHVDEVSARVRMTRGQHMAYLRRVELPRRLRPGSTVRARLVVKVVRGEQRTIRFGWRVPSSLPAGRRTLTFKGPGADGTEDFFSELFGEDEGIDAEGLRRPGQIVRAFKRLKRYDGISLRKHDARVYRDPELRIGGKARTTVVVRRGGR